MSRRTDKIHATAKAAGALVTCCQYEQIHKEIGLFGSPRLCGGWMVLVRFFGESVDTPCCGFNYSEVCEDIRRELLKRQRQKAGEIPWT